MRSEFFVHIFVGTIVIATGLTTAGCGKKKEGAAMGMQMQIPVVGFKARQQPIAEKISLIGTLEANEVVEIKSEIDGAVEEIHFEEGQKVNKGDLLILIDQRKLKAALDQADANLKLAQTTDKRYQTLIENGAVSRQELEQATATFNINRADVEMKKAELHDATISAPFDGIMGRRMVSQGQFIAKGVTLSFLFNQDPIKVNVRVPERYLSRIKQGQKTEMNVAAYPGEKFTGAVFFVDPQIDELTRTTLVKAKIPNPDGKLRHGMFANLQLTINNKENAVVIPETALILKGDATEVYTVNADDTAVSKPVKVGVRLAGFVEITDGIAEGETVVVEGFQKLGPGAKAKVRFEENNF